MSKPEDHQPTSEIPRATKLHAHSASYLSIQGSAKEECPLSVLARWPWYVKAYIHGEELGHGRCQLGREKIRAL